MPGPDSQPVTIVDARDDDFRLVPEFYRTVIVPNFAPDELQTEAELMSGLRSGRSRVLIAVAAGGAMLGGAVGDFFPRSNVMLLSYLVVLGAGRGQGIGATVLQAAKQAWTEELSPRLILLEVEDPREFTGSAAFGDPAARVRFYERHGVRALPLPYMQPALGPGTARVPGLMLMVAGGTDAPADAGAVDGKPVASFLAEYFEESEGPAQPDDTELSLLLAACDRPGGLPLMTVRELPSLAERQASLGHDTAGEMPGHGRGDPLSLEFLWYIPNTVEPGHRGDTTTEGWGSLEFSTDQARALEEHGWGGALLGASWGRPDTFTVATAIAALTTTFKPLIAIRPGYWQPAHFAAAAATLDQLTGGRVLVNIVTGIDHLAAYGDANADPAQRYDRTREFMHLVRRLWTQEDVTFHGQHFQVEDSTLAPRPYGAAEGRHPTLYFGGASEAAQRVAATEADVQLFWGEPLDGIAERIDTLKSLSSSLGRQHPPLQFGLRITTLVRDTTEQAWRDAEDKVAKMATDPGEIRIRHSGPAAVGQQRLHDLAARGEVLDSCLYTTPGKVGGGGAATTWLVGSPADVAAALKKYQDLGVTHFVLSDTPYRREIIRVGDQLLPLLGQPAH